MTDTNQFVQAQKLRLAGSGCTSSASSIILASFYLADSTTLAAMSNFGTIGFMTIEPATSKEENISFTGITQNGDGTATLTGVTRGLGFVAPYTNVSANQKAHAGGVTVIVSNSAPFYNRMISKGNDETIDGLYTFTQLPQSSAVPSAGADLINKTYADALVLGVLTTINVIVPGKAGENVSAGQLVYFDLTDNEWKLTDADTAATVNGVQLGIAQGTGTNGVAITGGVLLQGVDTHQSGLVEGDVQYAGNTAGAISTTPGTTEVTVGIAKSATELYFSPRFDQQITEDQQDAMGGTSGTPSSTNKFVTADDVSASATADKIVRRDGSGLIAGSVTAKFGGTGADGALALTSGATNIDLGGLAVVTKNYTSISITGTGSLTFTNPHANGTIIILKSQGNVTLTSSTAPMIDARGMGAAAQTIGTFILDVAAHLGTAGSTGVNGNGGTGGNGGTAGVAITESANFYTTTENNLVRRAVIMAAGSGGSAGGTGTGGTGGVSAAGGAGGAGGAGLHIECAGAWNFTTASGISVAGGVGGTGTASSGAGGASGGGGGGGAGGFFIALYNTLTANSGTVTVSGGGAGNGGGAGTGGGSTNTGGGGGGGASAGSINTTGNAGTVGGGGGGGAGGAGGAGGTGLTGYSVVSLNSWFV